MVAVAFLITVLSGAVLYVVLGSDSRRIAEMQITAAVLAQAREALIGRAASDNNRPGSLPCPDLVTNIPGINVPNDGIADLLVGNECPSYIGRLPWRTLDLPDPRDASGERLWYALSRAFRDDNSAQPINTNTAGTLSISGSMTAGNLVAIVFAPGPVIANQVRDTPNANGVENYLEGGNQASGTTSFIAAATTASFNDQSLVLGSDALLPVVETRVAREASSVLAAFYTANGFFPYANSYGDNTYQCADSQYSGRIPRFFANSCKSTPGDPDWNGAIWPGWFFANNWHEVVFYAVATQCATPAAPGCSAPGTLLTVNGVPAPNTNIQAIVIMPGRAYAGQTRPCAAVADCLEDAENTDGDAEYVKSAVTPTLNDRLFVVAP
jgi:hypothetical protein